MIRVGKQSCVKSELLIVLHKIVFNECMRKETFAICKQFNIVQLHSTHCIFESFLREIMGIKLMKSHFNLFCFQRNLTIKVMLFYSIQIHIQEPMYHILESEKLLQDIQFSYCLIKIEFFSKKDDCMAYACFCNEYCGN